MIERLASCRYARSLFLLAEERQELDAVQKDFRRICELTGRHPEIMHLLLNSTLSIAEKEDFMEKVFAQREGPTSRPLTGLLLNFLKVLIKKGRFRELVSIQNEFQRLVEKKRGLQKVEVWSAVPLTGAGEEKLKDVLKKRLRAEVELTLHTDPAVIGGLILRFDGREIDGSYRSQLMELKQRLMR